MPQELHVVCCCSCKMFQVDIVKKTKKWICKVCNEKQSLQRVYFQGSGKDCRAYVQKLNTIRHTQTEMLIHVQDNTDTPPSEKEDCQENPPPRKVQSKWTKYLDSPEESTEYTVQQTSTLVNHEGTTDEISEHSNIDDIVADGTDISQSSGSNAWNIDHRNTQEISEIDDDKLDKLSQINTTTVQVEKDKSKGATKSKSIFDNNEEIDLTLDF